MAIDIYGLPAVAHARASVEKYRAKIESGIGQAQTLAEIGGSSYLTARLSAHLGGPEGKAFLGVPLELAVGAACGALAMSGSAGKHTEDILAVGVGAIAAYTARLGFQAGLQTARPPLVGAADGLAVPQVGAWPQITYALPPPPVAALLPPQVPFYAPPPQVPVYVPAPPPPRVEEPPPPPLAVVSGPEPEEVGADPYASATAVLDQIAQSGR
ncbi:MAG: hypothetical protein U1E65_21890 [Myxococcota bacterium]